MASESQTFLFRFDGSPENDAFLEEARSQGHLVYAGISMQLEHGWILDFLEAVLSRNETSCALAIVELEAKPSTARVSARKYLPESSSELVANFCRYLVRVIDRCRASADPRAENIQALYDVLVRPSAVVSVWTVGALRQAPYFVERLPLIDQGALPESSDWRPQQGLQRSLGGKVTLSPRNHKTLSRSILILDAIVREWDKSDATLRAWVNLRSQPLRQQIRNAPHDYPALTSLLLTTKLGVQIVTEDVAQEISTIWNQFQSGMHSADSVVLALEAFLPIDRSLDPNASVRIAFEKARTVLPD